MGAIVSGESGLLGMRIKGGHRPHSPDMGRYAKRIRFVGSSDNIFYRFNILVHRGAIQATSIVPCIFCLGGGEQPMENPRPPTPGFDMNGRMYRHRTTTLGHTRCSGRLYQARRTRTLARS